MASRLPLQRPDSRRSDSPRAVLARHGLDAKKSWGQNFLVDRAVRDRIAARAGPGPDDVVVEIGAGLGTLTAALLSGPSRPRRIIAVERDPDMLKVLRAELAGEPCVEVRAEDAVHFDYLGAAQAAGRPLLVVGNLPYQITTALLFAIADAGDAVIRAVVMVQREFAERVVAAPGSKTYGRLSVMIQQRMRVQRLFNVGPGAFFPRPRVVSSLLEIAHRAAPLAAVDDQALFARVVKEAFATRRKMLRRSLGDAFGEQIATTALAASGIAGTRRPEELSVAELAALTNGVALAQAQSEFGPRAKPVTGG